MKLLFFTLLVLVFFDAHAQNFDPLQQAYIMEDDTDTPMRVFLITQKADSILLRTPSEEVILDEKDTVLQHFIQRLHRTVTDSASMGVGIAAPQVGILKQIIWVQRFDKGGLPWEVYLNPKITFYSEEKQECVEGCLSIPNKSASMKIRAKEIEIEYDSPDGTHHVERIKDFTAVIFQHEIDHLNGIMFTDHLAEEMQSAGKK